MGRPPFSKKIHSNRIHQYFKMIIFRLIFIPKLEELKLEYIFTFFTKLIFVFVFKALFLRKNVKKNDKKMDSIKVNF